MSSARTSSEAICPSAQRVAIARVRRPRLLNDTEMQALLAQITGEAVNPLAQDEREQDLFRGLLAAALVGPASFALCLFLREDYATTSIVSSISGFLAYLIGSHGRPIRAREWSQLGAVLGLWSAGIAGAITLLVFLRPPPTGTLPTMNPAAQATLSQIVTRTFLAALAALILGCLAGWLLRRWGKRRFNGNGEHNDFALAEGDAKISRDES